MGIGGGDGGGKSREKVGSGSGDSSTSSEGKRKRASRKEAMKLIQTRRYDEINGERGEIEYGEVRVYRALLALGQLARKKTLAGDRA